MRLLLINYEYPPIGGGASVSAALLAEQLVKRGHEVHVLTSRVNGRPSTETSGGLSVHRVHSWRRSIHDCGLRGAGSFLALAMARMRRMLSEYRFDVMHCFFSLPCGPLGLYGSLAFDLPYVLSLRGSDVPGYDRTDPWLGRWHRVLAPLNRRVIEGAAFVVPNSVALRSLAASFEPQIDYHVIPNAVPESNATVAAANRASGPVRIICVSRLIPRKSLDVLIRAIDRLRDEDVEAIIIGDGTEAGRLDHLVRQLGLADRVTLAGPLPHEDVMSRYSAADIFVLPASSESCSMATLEAMSSGLPIITTRVGGNMELVTHGKNGLLVPAGSVDELAGAIRLLIRDAPMRTAMGEANRARAQRDFAPMANAEKFEELYVRAASTRRCR